VEIIFSVHEYAENLHTRSLVSLKRGFNDSSKSHFQASRMKKISTIIAKDLETLVSRIVRNRIFRLLKYGKFAHTKLGTLEPWVSRLGKKAFSCPQKCRKWFEEC